MNMQSSSIQEHVIDKSNKKIKEAMDQEEVASIITRKQDTLEEIHITDAHSKEELIPIVLNSSGGTPGTNVSNASPNESKRSRRKKKYTSNNILQKDNLKLKSSTLYDFNFTKIDKVDNNQCSSVAEENNKAKVCYKPRKRGRPWKTEVVKQRCTSHISVTINSKSESKSDEIGKRQTKKIKLADFFETGDGSDNSDNEILEAKIPQSQKHCSATFIGRKRGRPNGSSKLSIDIDYIPKMTFSQTKSNKNEKKTEEYKLLLKNDDNEKNISETNKTISKNVKCMKCNEEMQNSAWNNHNLKKHNGLSWRENDKPPNYEENEKSLQSYLQVVIKKKRGILNCELCDAVKRSVHGFLSHVQFCGKSEEERRALMINCEICNSTIMPSSVDVHMRAHRKAEKEKNMSRNETSVLLSDKRKRKAAEKAVSKIQEFTELVKDNEKSNESNATTAFKNIVKTSKLNKRIPGIIISIWKKSLVSNNEAHCRHPGCEYKSSSLEDISNHHGICSKKIIENEYTCKICKFFTDIMDEMMTHIETIHNGEGNGKITSSDPEETYLSADEIEGEVGDNGEEETTVNKKKSCLKNTNFTNSKKYRKNIRYNWNKCFDQSLPLTLEYELDNYEFKLFEDLTPNHFDVVNNNNSMRYLPKEEYSIAFKCLTFDSSKLKGQTKIDWKRLKRFEGSLDNDIPIFFVGGPIWAMAWLPIPAPMYLNNCDQYLAISTHPHMDVEYTVGKSQSGCNLIQIWNVGKLYSKNDAGFVPTLAYGIAHNDGTVWCLEWCPSGCYQDSTLNNLVADKGNLKRMGLLAAACSNGSVNIYSLPFPENLNFKRQDNRSELPIYETKPVMKLLVDIYMHDNNEQNWQCTSLSWSQKHGHSTIAAGFTNGYISLWNITSQSTLLRQKKKNTIFLNAYHTFYAHGNAVTMLCLSPYSDSNHLASGSMDKIFKLWDLEHTSLPQLSISKGVATSGIWMKHWPSMLVSFDDAFGWRLTNTCFIPLREYQNGIKTLSCLPSNGPTYGLTFSNHTNGIAHGTASGDIITVFAQKLLNLREQDKWIPKKRRLSSRAEVIEINKTLANTFANNKNNKEKSTEYMYLPDDYKTYKDCYGIIFRDDLIPPTNEYTGRNASNVEKLTPYQIEQYPIASANRIAWNVNTWSCLWLSVAYQNGLVRLLNFNYMNMKPEIDKWLPKHSASMLTKINKTNGELS